MQPGQEHVRARQGQLDGAVPVHQLHDGHRGVAAGRPGPAHDAAQDDREVDGEARREDGVDRRRCRRREAGCLQGDLPHPRAPAAPGRGGLHLHDPADDVGAVLHELGAQRGRGGSRVRCRLASAAGQARQQHDRDRPAPAQREGAVHGHRQAFARVPR